MGKSEETNVIVRLDIMRLGLGDCRGLIYSGLLSKSGYALDWKKAKLADLNFIQKAGLCWTAFGRNTNRRRICCKQEKLPHNFRSITEVNEFTEKYALPE